MSNPPTLDYQRPPPKDDRPFGITSFTRGFLSGVGVAAASVAMIGGVKSLVNMPPLFAIGVAVVATVLIDISIGKDVEPSSPKRGFLLGIVLSLPVLLLTCTALLIVAYMMT